MALRLQTGLRVSAFLKQWNAQGFAAFLLKRGEAERGAILLQRDFLDGKSALYEWHYDFSGEPSWLLLSDGQGEENRAIAEKIAKKCRFDDDLWVISAEDPQRSLW